MIGKIISHYKILEKLGEGGMGVVYKAEDTKLKRTVALKFLSPQAVGTEEDHLRFFHEAQAAAALNHPNICTIYEIDEYKNQPFIAMEYVEGEELKAKITSGPLSLDEAVKVTAEIAEGIKAAHDKGIVHRDIKPANIVLTPAGQAKIMDFGLAKSTGRSQITQAGSTMGTAAYMSPEQGRGDAVDHRTDIWSLGIVLYEMVAGEPPFKADYELATLYLITYQEPPSIKDRRPDIPAKLDKIINRALAKEPDHRYATAGDLLKDLHSIGSAGKALDPGILETDRTIKPSIAVLPFRDMSSHRDQEYFCEGIAEELINALVKLEGLRVAARTSAFQFKDAGSDIQKIGRELKVKTVLEGSVRKEGNQLRITAQLINIDDGFHLWSDKYDRELKDIFTIQDEISLAIVDKLKVKLLGEERSALVKRHTVDQEAHNLYLKGLYFWNRRLEGGMKKAMEFFHQAIEKDPGYALAYVGVADTFNISAFFGYLPPEESFPRAKAAAARALELDETIGEAHASLAWFYTFYEWNWSNAEHEFERAIELAPNYASAHEWYAIYLFLMCRFEEAIREVEHAQNLDPLSLIINAVIGIVFYFADRANESIAHFKKALELDPNFLLTSTWVVLAYVELGRFDEALETMRKVEALAADNAYTLGYFGHSYGRIGQKEEALRIISRLDEMGKERYVSPVHRAHVFTGLGETEKALDNLEAALKEKNPLLVFLAAAPFFDGLRSNPQFQSLIKKVGFEE